MTSRVCPGMNLADRLAFHIVATIISVFELVPLEGKTLPNPKDVEWSDTAIQYVNQYLDPNLLFDDHM
jgi:hypothetical protein